MRRGWAALSVNGKKENLFEISGQEMGADEKILVLHETPDIRIEKIIFTFEKNYVILRRCKFAPALSVWSLQPMPGVRCD